MTSGNHNFARYLPVNQEALKWEIYCNDAGYTHVHPGVVYPPNPGLHPSSHSSTVATGRILREFQAVYVTAGQGEFTDRIKGTRAVEPGTIFLLFPGVWHSYKPKLETGWQEYWVGFSGAHAYRLHKNRLLDPTKPLHQIGLNQEVIADYEQIIQLCREQSPGFQIRLGALVLQLLAHISVCEMNKMVNPSDNELVNTARALMQLHLDSGMETETLADELGITYTHLLTIFRQYTGMTPYHYYIQMRMHRAKELLLDPKHTVKTVSAHMNFDNQYYFSRLFKKKTGYTPSQWRTGKES